LKLDSAAAILQTVTVGTFPSFPAFDGTNIWVPNAGSLTVVRAATGAVLQTLTGNGLGFNLIAAAFDGERVPRHLSDRRQGVAVEGRRPDPARKLPDRHGDGPFGVCSDGLNFWVGLINAGKIARF
jgi:hypothetical protein